MKFLRKTFSVLFGLALLGGLSVSGYFTFHLIVELVGHIGFQAAAITAIASAVMLLATLIIARSMYLASKQAKTNQLRTKKTAAYQLFIDLWEGLFRHGRDATERLPNTLSENLLALDRLLILYGSARVVKAHTVLRVLERELGIQNPQVKLQFTTVLMEIRQDLGLETRGLTVAELLSILFADADQVNSPATASSYQDLRPRVSLASSS